EAGEIEHAASLALEMGGHAEERAQRDDAGAADAGDEDAIGFAQRARHRQRQRREGILLGRGGGAVQPAEAAAMHRDEARAEALEAGIILVAIGLVDGALPAELGLDRLHRHAVRLLRAVAAPLADELVDEDAARRVGELAALPAP